MRVSLIKGGGGDSYYELGLLSGLIAQGIQVDFVGSERDDQGHSDILRDRNVTFFALRGNQDPQASLARKVLRILGYYARLWLYALKTSSRIFHIQWTERFAFYDRTILNLYYKLLGKKIVFTAHNVNAGERDGRDGPMNRMTLRFMYRIVDRIIVHTEMMKQQLAGRFGVPAAKVTVIEHGINSMVPRTDLTPREARLRLGLPGDERVMLFFGNITPYKGLEYLCAALARLRETDRNLKLIIAGRITNRENAAYWETIEAFISESELEGALLRRTEFVPDDEIEIYFKAADVLILPYRRIFQSGVLFLSYAFGLPVIAADVGSLRGSIIEGKTGFLSRPEDAADLARTIDGYFKSDLYKHLDCRRDEIVDYANRTYSWRTIGAKTKSVYDGLSRT